MATKEELLNPQSGYYTQQPYYLRPGETPEAYNARIAALRTPAPPVAPPKPAAITLPDQPSLPNQAGAATTPTIQGLSSSLPTVNEEDLRRQVTEQYAPSRKSLEDRLNAKIQETQGLGVQEKRSLEGELGTRRRFSSSAQAFIKFIDDENKKKIAELELQREDALTNFDFKLAEAISTRISGERKKQQEEFDNALKIIDFSQKQQEAEQKQRDEERKKELEANKSLLAVSREAAIIDLFNKGFKSVQNIHELINFDEAGNQIGDITAEEIDKVLKKLSSPSELADVVFKNPILFKGLSPTQMGEITADLEKRGFNFAAALAKEEPVTKPDTLTLDERKKLYPDLPLSLVGKSEKEVLADLESTTPPKWFIDIQPEGAGDVSTAWNDFRNKVITIQRSQSMKKVDTEDEPLY